MGGELAIYGINGPVATVLGRTELGMGEMVFVGEKRLIGEVISISEQKTTIQVYENTTGLRCGEPVEPTGHPIRVILGPGMLNNIYDGIQRPLRTIEDISGCYIAPGLDIPGIDCEKKWDITVLPKEGDLVKAGDIYAKCGETTIVEHRFMIPYGISGRVQSALPSGPYRVTDEILRVITESGETAGVALAQRWPIRKPRPVKERLAPDTPLITGQRIIDTLFPIAKGGAAAIPGGFGTGKTMLQHQLAKWSDADIIIYVGCGERGNEMTQVLEEFSELIDPKTKKSMLERTVLIANTSNMPVAAREASIYTGITIAEYYRDMGYHVAIMADSTSRWAEALREISGRLEEMPAEEGFPAYLPSRLAAFYERSGIVGTLGGRVGSLTIIGAVSPQGNDFSEPVTQNTKRFIRCFWALEKSLAYARHYPAINWNSSYSEYIGELDGWFFKNVNPEFGKLRARLKNILGEEARLMEIVKLIGSDLLADDQKLILETARVIRSGFLQQNATNPNDAYAPIQKQYLMLKTIIKLYDRAKELISRSVPISQLKESGAFDALIRSKYEIQSQPEKYGELWDSLEAKIKEIEDKYIQ
ncbi:MAG: V-type ATP synthase subunit A [Oscillospiraceae bacterium]|nr:V-type ATP synthase subunit A [Oscillospiraceae bacterium]